MGDYSDYEMNRMAAADNERDDRARANRLKALSPAPTEPISGGAAGREPAGAGEDGRRHLLPLGRAATVAELLQCAAEDAELITAELQEAPEPSEEDLVRIVGRAEQLALGLRCALRVLRARLRTEALEAITREVKS